MRPLIFSILLASGNANANEIIETIERIAIEEGVDPEIAVAIAKVESRLNPDAVGALGELGIFQLRPEYHDVRVGEVEHNIRVAIRYLKTIERICSDYPDQSWVNCFNRGPYRDKLKRPLEFGYYRKIMAEIASN